MIALRDLQRQIATTHSTTPRCSRAIQLVAAVAVWLLTAVVVGFFVANPYATKEIRVALWGIVAWTTGVIVYAWTTTPSSYMAGLPIVRSRVALLYDKYFGLNGKVIARCVHTQLSQLNPPPPPGY